jgi:hypothetical protein
MLIRVVIVVKEDFSPALVSDDVSHDMGLYSIWTPRLGLR